MSIAAQSFFYALLKSGKTDALLKNGPIGHLFSNEYDKKLFDFVDGFVREYGTLPEVATLQNHTGATLTSAPEPPAYYLDLLRARYVELSVREAAKLAEKFLTGEVEQKDPFKAFELLTGMLAEVRVKNMAQSVIDYREAGDLLKNEYIQQANGLSAAGLKLGWPYLDNICGGIIDGDVISVVARSGMGKTFLLLWMGLSVWLQGKPVLFVSMEIKPLPLMQRLAAIHMKKDLSALKKGELVTSAHKDYFSKLNALPGHPVPFWVVDGNLTATIADIEALALILKPGLIVIDGAYLAKHPTEKDRYRRIAENMDLIKMDLAALAPTICSWQFNRDLKKLKKGEEGGLDEIGGSAAIGHHSSLVLGLFEDDTVETEKRRRVSIKKGRNGEEGEFFIKWAFTQQTTDFSQVEEETLETLAF